MKMKWLSLLGLSVIFTAQTGFVQASSYKLEVSYVPSQEKKCNGYTFHYKIDAFHHFKIKDLTKNKTTNQFVDLRQLGMNLKEKFSTKQLKPQLSPVAYAFNPRTKKMISMPLRYCLTYEMNHNYELKFAKDWSAIESSDLILSVVPSFDSRESDYGGKISIAGMTHLLSRFIFIDESTFNKSYNGVGGIFNHIILHEEGHRLGLEHTENQYEDNLMSYKRPFSNVISDTQRMEILGNYLNSNFVKITDGFVTHKNTKIIINKNLYFGDDHKDQINDILKYHARNYYL